MLEDEVIDVLAKAARARGLAVLAEGGNQMRAFRYVSVGGRRKAPDLVLFGEGQLVCFEAKIQGGSLLRVPKVGPSDVETQIFAHQSRCTRDALAKEGQRRLAAAGRVDQIVKSVGFGLISATWHEDVEKLSHEFDLCYVVCDVSTGSWRVPVSNAEFEILFKNPCA